MAHVSWPTRTQTVAFTLIVVFISLFVAVYLSAFDALFTQGLRVALDNAPRFSQTTPNVDVQVASSTVSGTSTTPNFTITPITSTTTTK